MNKMKVNDSVIVLAGKDKGKTGVITKVLENDRVIVDGVNMVKKHQKPNPAANEPGGIVSKAMPLHRSNIALVNSVTGKADRVGFKTLEDGKKVRYFKSNGEVLGA
ncbi:MAG: 50S ribosomal protein L24 [Immundisolibacteraceae bacterium]|jgi:large subunit ribosomal protein L24|nr:50S ribosomal protein L24 [Immundisolibacteraceae bacterium]